MAERRKKVDAVIIGYGWTGAIMAKTLTDAGLSVVALERGPARDTSPDFEYPRIADELKYGVVLPHVIFLPFASRRFLPSGRIAYLGSTQRGLTEQPPEVQPRRAR
jgi:choline dehydrogenase-like flavoprotein